MLELDPFRRVVRSRPAHSSVAISVGVAIGLAATGIALVHAGFTAPEPNCPPVVVPAAPTAPAVAPLPVAAPANAPCVPVEEQKINPGEWTWGHDHIGPFTACTRIDRAFVERVVPEGLDVRTDDTRFVVTRKGQLVMTIETAPLRVEIESPELETPWRVHVGDTFKTLRAHHRDIVCVSDSVEPADGTPTTIWCAQTHDGWRENLRYQLDARALDGKGRSAVDELDFDGMGPLKIRSIIWQPTR